jgi:uroporphyrinogen decarboxylase
MRQAGRYLPEYREVRNLAGSFLNLCYSPTLAAKVTMQPIERFDFDAAIIFSDILVVPHSLGLNLDFVEGEGPIVEKIKNNSDLKKIKEKISESLSIVKSSLSKEKTLIGFIGAPWTILSYILDYPKRDFDALRTMCYLEPDFIDNLLDIIVEQSIYYVEEQILAGADVIQIFDSWSGIIPEELFSKYVIESTKKIVYYIKNSYPNVPVICFPRDSGMLYERYIRNVPCDGIGIDYLVPLDMAKNWQGKLVVQGNMDPCVLLSTKDIIASEVNKIMNSLGGKNFIFNLGHGILPQTPVENVEHMINCVRRHKNANSSNWR